ncbi:hypothetical protein DLM86_16810 [Paenibacillus flagellatus]|uniref:Uncharacterized protein n=1 Tax=Paenibacillus flagellatus TaxID=2211139 RepID=A0A2V5KVA7_9BACL|nr:hypothetical protein DLM86_16810 [Paenibacillus flagellatus]
MFNGNRTVGDSSPAVVSFLAAGDPIGKRSLPGGPGFAPYTGKTSTPRAVYAKNEYCRHGSPGVWW